MKKINTFVNFTNNLQQDASEFFTSLFQYCEENCNGFKDFFSSKVQNLGLCVECGKFKKDNSTESGSISCVLPQRFFPIYEVKIGSVVFFNIFILYRKKC